MDMISLQGKTNFFEKRVSDYRKANIKTDLVPAASATPVAAGQAPSASSAPSKLL